MLPSLDSDRKTAITVAKIMKIMKMTSKYKVFNIGKSFKSVDVCPIETLLLVYCFYPRDAMLARVFATATCLSVRLSHAGIVPSRAKAGS